MSARLPSNRLAKQLNKRTQNHFYGDTAKLTQNTVTSLDAYGQPAVTATVTTIACNFTDKPQLENWRRYGDVEEIAAEIRFQSPAPAAGNTIQLTGKFDDSAFEDMTFEIVDIKNRGTFGYACALKKVSL